ncbi:Regulator of sigma-E protease RseP [Halomonadaceae bacterium LMG 33818]|uniref:RIP metalloprotease RseP n=1 Tax=Cernens ardua TaxID=3402176 RepID=UPI003EDC4763
MDIVENIIAVIVVLGILITFHEFGHFWVARRCGVKVLRFSIGFGKPLYLRKGASGTEFAISCIPFGGYVKMLDEREAPVPQDELPYAFNRQSIFRRIAIVAAGPIANFILAFLLYWVLFIHGITGIAPVVGAVSPSSPAESGHLKTGEEITAIQGRNVRSWQEANLALLALIGQNSPIQIETADGQMHAVPVSRFLVGQNPPDPLPALGIAPWEPPIPARVSYVMKGSPAERAGLKAGDNILSIQSKVVREVVSQWEQFAEQVRQSPGKTLVLEVRHSDGSLGTIRLTPESKLSENREREGYIGAAAQAEPYPHQYLRNVRYSPLAALPQAVRQTGEMTWLTVDSLGKMVIGLISPRNLSGPITIARVAGASARSGIESFIGFLAYLSISLGVINLLPIPVLDGGHLLYFVIEAIRGRPLSEKVQLTGLQIGVTLVAVVMFMAFYFDIMRL